MWYGINIEKVAVESCIQKWVWLFFVAGDKLISIFSSRLRTEKSLNSL